jgi:hypothetical protein
MDPYNSGKSLEVRQEFSPKLVFSWSKLQCAWFEVPDYESCLYQTLSLTKIKGYKVQGRVGLIGRQRGDTKNGGIDRHMATMAIDDGSDSFR